jgi:N-acetylneuraminate synthase/N,N'-diacetyllegionaminate synthase
MQDVVKIGGREIGDRRSVFVVAEAGINHNGKVDWAKRLIEEAVIAGADAIKFQSFIAERLLTKNHPNFSLFKRVELSWKDQESLFRLAKERGIVFLSTPFDENSADMLDGLGVEAFKIASTDITNLHLISHIAGKGRPLILSTGASNLGEVERAVEAIEREGNREIILLHCTSTYPAKMESLNLKAIQTLRRVFGYPVGFSDHTIGTIASLVAVALGAVLIEKHFTLNRSLDGPDHPLSVEPKELKGMVKEIEGVMASLGNGKKRPAQEEIEIRKKGRRGIVARREIPQGATITNEMVDLLRPQEGIPSEFYGLIIGRRTRRKISKGESIRWEDV